MKYTNYWYILSLFICAATSTANRNHSSSLRGSTESDNSNQRNHRRLGLTLGFSLSPGCFLEPPKTGDSCNAYQQQCLYPVTGSDDGTTIVDPSFWSCYCGKDRKYNCGIKCSGATSCTSTAAPVPAPAVEGRAAVLSQPDNATGCPQTYPGSQSGCQHPGMECDYLENSSVVSCACANLEGPPQVWHRSWKCYGTPSKTDRSGNSASIKGGN
mmetsp:Transcript_26172/g.57313  ORF Transcript_26172/g.57313 Transcript_26172/m.57313 type:complete len:213 (-) Transcript_26172:149-787(-)